MTHLAYGLSSSMTARGGKHMFTAETVDIPRGLLRRCAATLHEPSAAGASLLPFEDNYKSTLDFDEHSVGFCRKTEWAMLDGDDAGTSCRGGASCACRSHASGSSTSRAYSSSGGGTSRSCSWGGSCASSTACACAHPGCSATQVWCCAGARGRAGVPITGTPCQGQDGRNIAQSSTTVGNPH